MSDKVTCALCLRDDCKGYDCMGPVVPPADASSEERAEETQFDEERDDWTDRYKPTVKRGQPEYSVVEQACRGCTGPCGQCASSGERVTELDLIRMEHEIEGMIRRAWIDGDVTDPEAHVEAIMDKVSALANRYADKRLAHAGTLRSGRADMSESATETVVYGVEWIGDGTWTPVLLCDVLEPSEPAAQKRIGEQFNPDHYRVVELVRRANMPGPAPALPGPGTEEAAALARLRAMARVAHDSDPDKKESLIWDIYESLRDGGGAVRADAGTPLSGRETPIGDLYACEEDTMCGATREGAGPCPECNGATRLFIAATDRRAPGSVGGEG